MKIFFARFLITALLIPGIKTAGFGQAKDSDSIAIANTVAFYHKAIGHQSFLYNGPEYHYGDPSLKGNAFFADINTWQPGSVDYDGTTYHNVPMRYDIYSDLVVVQLYNKFTTYSLLSNRVSNFYLSNHHFIRIEASDEADRKTPATGFYDKLYDGKIKVIAKRIKTIQTSSGSTSEIDRFYTTKTEYFIKKGKSYYGFSGQGGILTILKDKKKEIEQYLKTNQIRFKDNPEASMIKIASYYDQLTN